MTNQEDFYEEPSIDEDDLEEDEDELEDDYDHRVFPEGIFCEDCDDPAFRDTAHGWLCEDCYEHYVDGFRRD